MRFLQSKFCLFILLLYLLLYFDTLSIDTLFYTKAGVSAWYTMFMLFIKIRSYFYLISNFYYLFYVSTS